MYNEMDKTKRGVWKTLREQNGQTSPPSLCF